ncbi:HNH endonuclease [Arthrobacter sp. B6]|uniref:HNH endonuclease n=1 Tax=Arthrobacter sp. B6 TaxID=1570137 RepID=UPI000835BD23|nr:HNH endonuclease [Arthrobacter sp. B6]
MSAIILGWDPARWNRWNYAAIVERVAVAGLHLEPWRIGRSVAEGTDAWLLLLGDHSPGLIGHGVVFSGQPELDVPLQTEPAITPAGPEFTVQVAFDALLPLGDHVPAGVLREAMPDVAWAGPETTGLALEPGHEATIRALWADYGPLPQSDPTQPVPGTYPGDAVARIAVNRYERDPEARRACIAHRGINCAACGFSFEMAYGEVGADFIHVHHVVPASQLGNGYVMDPLTDLVPLCANCHAMAHHGVSSPRSEAELRRIIANAGYLRGTTVTPEQLEAQRAAREILGQ